MESYLTLLKHVLDGGIEKEDRTGTGTLSCFGYQMRFNLQEGFPLVTTKKIHTKSIVHELLWFISGNTNIKYLKDNKVKIWDAWADDNGDLGPVYGSSWRSWPKYAPTPDPEKEAVTDDSRAYSIDQLLDVIEQIKVNPCSRRLIVSSWNVALLEKMALPPCHLLFQFNVERDKLNCHLYQRSADVFLGVPFNIASYSLLTHMVAQVCGLEAGDFIHSFGDVHLYKNHIDQAKLQLSRSPKPLPKLWLNPSIKNIEDFTYEDIKILNYEYHPTIKGKVSV